MIKLFFGREPLDYEIVQDQERPSDHPAGHGGHGGYGGHGHHGGEGDGYGVYGGHGGDGGGYGGHDDDVDDMKEIPIIPPYYSGNPGKLDAFPYDSVAQPYDSSKNLYRQKQAYLNREYTFKPFFAGEDEQVWILLIFIKYPIILYHPKPTNNNVFDNYGPNLYI
jgi:hypothetical protein